MPFDLLQVGKFLDSSQSECCVSFRLIERVFQAASRAIRHSILSALYSLVFFFCEVNGPLFPKRNVGPKSNDNAGIREDGYGMGSGRLNAGVFHNLGC